VFSEIHLSVIVPCYNEEAVIGETYKRTKGVLESMSLKNYELLFINDGSKDATLAILQSFAAKNTKVKVLNFSRNFGHQAAVSAGLAHCTGNVAIIIDGDLQDPPELFPDLLRSHLDQQANVVYCVRESRQGETFFKKVTSKLFYKLINFISDVELPVDTGDFRLIDRNVIDAFNNLPEKNKYIRGLITWVGFKQVPFYYQREARFAGETKYPLSKMLKFATTSMLYFSKKPLKLALSLGLFSMLIGLMLAVYVILGIFFRADTLVSGWASTIISLIFFGGVQLVTIGVLGEYIGNMFEEVKNRPEYIVAQKINF
jgi:polyisoprenyl-phosphate glycosyltransferase